VTALAVTGRQTGSWHIKTGSAAAKTTALFFVTRNSLAAIRRQACVMRDKSNRATALSPSLFHIAAFAQRKNSSATTKTAARPLRIVTVEIVYGM